MTWCAMLRHAETPKGSRMVPVLSKDKVQWRPIPTATRVGFVLSCEKGKSPSALFLFMICDFAGLQ
jgi:hypothetical protein